MIVPVHIGFEEGNSKDAVLLLHLENIFPLVRPHLQHHQSRLHGKMIQGKE